MRRRSVNIAALIVGIWAAFLSVYSSAQSQQTQRYDLSSFKPLPALETTTIESEIARDGQDDLGDLSLLSEPSDIAYTAVESPENGINFGSSGSTRVGYDNGFVIANDAPLDLDAGEFPFMLRVNGWGQIRQTHFDSKDSGPSGNRDASQLQLKRARIIFSGSAFSTDFSYFFQLDGRSSSGDDMRLLDFRLDYDIGSHRWGWDDGAIVFRTGKYKMPFTMSRYLTSQQFEFSDRSVASMYFDVNRSLAWGLYGQSKPWRTPLNWEIAIFNGLVTGGAETGSSGALDTNFAYSGRLMWYPVGDWGIDEMADFIGHCELATRIGAGVANSTIDRAGSTEFDSIRVVDSGDTLASILPLSVDQYTVNLFSLDASMKYRGWSVTTEYYFRQIDDIRGAPVSNLFDYGYWLQIGKFVIPQKLQLMTRWSRVIGESGTLGLNNESSSEFAVGLVRYSRGQDAKITFDATYLDGAPIKSDSLDISPGDIGWLIRLQIQFSF